MAEDFTLTGKINLGSRYEGYKPDGETGGDGIAFVFTTANPGTTGLAGASIGLGGINNSFGFKLDTYHNTSRPKADAKSDADPQFNGYQNGAFGAFYRTDGSGTAKYDRNDATRLTTQPTNNTFQDIKVTYNGKTKDMTVTYAGQLFTKNLTQWLAESRKTTKQAAGLEELAFALFASTGGAHNLQQFELEKFEYTAGGSYVVVKHVDANTGKEIKGRTVHRYDGGSNNSVNLANSKNVPGYVIVANNVNTARGYAGGETVNYMVGSQTVTYSYRVDKSELERLINEAPGVKASAPYYNETTPTDKQEYDNAISSATVVRDNTNASLEEVTRAVERIKAVKHTKISSEEISDGREYLKRQYFSEQFL